MDSKLFLLFLSLVVVSKETFGYVIDTTRCVYTKNEEILEQNFSSSTQICCNKSGVHDKYHTGVKMECCGEYTFKPDIELCCGEKVSDKTSEERICIGNNTIDKNANEFWCGNKGTSQLLQCCNGKTPYNASLFKCMNNKVVPVEYDICKDEFYDKRKQICCNRSKLYGVSSYQSNFKCCGSSLIDKRINQCCIWSGSAFVQSKTGHCCGGQLFKPNSEICCKGKRIVADNNTRCCGDGFYNSSFQLCCYSERSATPFNKTSEKCCQGLVLSVRNLPKPRCCGNQVYSSRSQVCRGGVIKRRKESCTWSLASGNAVPKETFYLSLEQVFPDIRKKLKKWNEKKGFPLIYVNRPEANIYLGRPLNPSSPDVNNSA